MARVYANYLRPSGCHAQLKLTHCRHTTAVHLLEAGVEVNVIRGWLGHVSLATTNRYADINLRTKEAALRQCAPPPGVGGPKARAPVWRNDEAMLAWLASL